VHLVGIAVRRRRNELSLTQQELAVRAGCSDSTISNIERNWPAGVSEITAHNVATALGRSVEDLRSGPVAVHDGLPSSSPTDANTASSSLHLDDIEDRLARLESLQRQTLARIDTMVNPTRADNLEISRFIEAVVRDITVAIARYHSGEISIVWGGAGTLAALPRQLQADFRGAVVRALDRGWAVNHFIRTTLPEDQFDRLIDEISKLLATRGKYQLLLLAPDADLHDDIVLVPGVGALRMTRTMPAIVPISRYLDDLGELSALVSLIGQLRATSHDPLSIYSPYSLEFDELLTQADERGGLAPPLQIWSKFESPTAHPL